MNVVRQSDPAIQPKKRNPLIPLVQIACFIGLLAIIVSQIDTAKVLDAMSEFSVPAIAAAVALHIAIVVLLSWRFILLFQGQGFAGLSALRVCRMTFGATLANLLLPTGLLGDAGRVWLIRKHGVDTRLAVNIGISDRLAGLVALALAAATGALTAPSLVPEGLAVMAVLLAAALSVALYVFLPAAGSTRSLGMVVGSLLGLSLVGHVAATAIAYLLLHSAGEFVSPLALLAVFPALLLAAALPVSIGGWGSRELAAMVSLPLIGIDENIAVAMSIMFGLTQVAATLVGLAMLTLFAEKAS